MKTINLSKFVSIGDSVAKPVTIVIDSPVPEYKEFDAMIGFFNDQAKQLVEALYHSLPQATFDRVAKLMFEKKMSLFRGQTDGF